MGARRYLDEAAGILLTARRRAELHKYSKELLYNIEVLIRACSRVSDQIAEENRVRQIQESEAKLKAYQEKIKATHISRQSDSSDGSTSKVNTGAKRKKKNTKTKSCPKKRTRKVAA